MTSLTDRLVKNSTIKETAVISKSKIFGKKDVVSLPVPALNVALSAAIDGGLTSGLTVLAGPSKHFKSKFMLLMAKTFLTKYPEGAVLFYDSEFGTPDSYIDEFGEMRERIVHTPLMNIEQFKFDIVNQLDNIARDDKIMIICDSVGNMASKKEATDALKQNEAQDMTRPKQLKSLFRIITPYLTILDIPMVAVNHVYEDMGMFPKQIVSGGTGIYLSADNIWIIGRQQNKVDTEIVGYNFIINVDKSRYLKEKSRIPISVTYSGGINKWSGMVDWALEGGYITKPAQGWYQYGEKKLRLKDFENDDAFWCDVLDNTDISTFIENKYALKQVATDVGTP